MVTEKSCNLSEQPVDLDLDHGRAISNESPSSPSSNNNQSIKKKHNPRMTFICCQVLPFFSVSTHCSWLAFFSLLFIQLKPHYLRFSGFILLYVQLPKKYYEMSFIYDYSHFQYPYCNQPVLFAQLENVNKLQINNHTVDVNEIKTKAKPSQVTFKMATHSIVQFSPKTIQWYH